MLQIVYALDGKEVAKTLEAECLIGRGVEEKPANLLLTEQSVSRRHARIWREGDEYWIEDQQSRCGTLVNGTRISQKTPLRSGDVVGIANIRLRVLPSNMSLSGLEALPGALSGGADGAADAASQTQWGAGLSGIFPAPVAVPPDEGRGESVVADVDANAADFLRAGAQPEETARRLEVWHRMSREFSAAMSLEAFAKLVLDRLMESFPKAKRGSFAMYDRGKDEFLLKARASSRDPGLSQTLAKRAMNEAKAFIFDRVNMQPVLISSITDCRIECAMYAPMLWQGRALGVLCVDNPNRYAAKDEFTEDELRLMVAVAQSAAPALANHILQSEQERQAQVQANFVKQFSPKVAHRLLHHRGRIRPGGTRCEVTVLCSDIRGFTRIAKDMEPDDVVELLNDYFTELIPILSALDGTVDKFVGDAILAVFGSPDADDHQHKKAVSAAWKMQAAVHELNAKRAAKGKVCCGVGIGIHCGEVVHGFIGSVERMEFTVIGDAVNYATRFCDGAKEGQILISPQVYEHVWRLVTAEETTISTKHEGALNAYRVDQWKPQGGPA